MLVRRWRSVTQDTSRQTHLRILGGQFNVSFIVFWRAGQGKAWVAYTKNQPPMGWHGHIEEFWEKLGM